MNNFDVTSSNCARIGSEAMVAKDKWLLEQAESILEEIRGGFPQYRSALDGTRIRISRRLTRSAGNVCVKTRTVGISEPIFAVEENLPQFRNTVLHELAHVIAGDEVQPHGSRWKSIFLEIGGNGVRCHEMRARGQHHSHQARCDRCDQEVEVGTRIWNLLRAGSLDYFHEGCGGVVTAAGRTDAPVDENGTRGGLLRQIGLKLRQALLFETIEKP